MNQAYQQEVSGADKTLRQNDVETAFVHLERAHVRAQRTAARHAYIHARMLVAGLRCGDLPEVSIAAVFIGMAVIGFTHKPWFAVLALGEAVPECAKINQIPGSK